MRKDARIYVAGHGGLVGSAITRLLRDRGYGSLILAGRSDVDLRDPAATRRLFRETEPEYVFMAAARVGGILANDSFPADFIGDNLAIELSVIEAAREFGTRRLLFLGSSCIYPRDAPQPMKEEHLLTGPLEPTNQWYAVAKIAGLKLCQAYKRQYGVEFFSVMPTNLYGPGDNFDLATSHVLPALMRKFDEAKRAGADTVEVWGSGTPRREFLHVDDLADACLFLMNHDDPPEIVNVGVGADISILDLAELVREVVGFEGDIVLDPSKPDGAPRKLLDVSVMETLGWTASIGLAEGVAETYRWYRETRSAQPLE